MPLVPRPAIDALQRIGGTRVGAAVGRRAFRGVIRAIAADLGRIRDVRSVNLTGSWTHPVAAAPGYSDVDLLLTVDVPTLARELELRESLHAVQRRWNSVAKFLKHLDYLEHRDVELFLRGGDYYWLDARARYASLVGNLGTGPVERVHRSPTVARVSSCLRRWMHVSPVLMDPTFVRDDAITRRAAARLLTGVLTMRLDVDPLTPFEDLIDRARSEVPEARDLDPSIARGPTGELVEHHLVVALRVLDAFCADVTRDFEDASADDAAQREEFARFDEAARSVGFAGGTIAEVPPPADTVVACVLTDDDALTSVRRLRSNWSTIALPERLLAPGNNRPALVTRNLWRAAGLFWPMPECGDALARASSAFGAPNRLPDDVRDAILATRTLHLFHRSRGHAFRVDRSPEAKLNKLRADLTSLAPHLRTLRSAPPLDLPRLNADATESVLLERLRDVLDVERDYLARTLGLAGTSS